MDIREEARAEADRRWPNGASVRHTTWARGFIEGAEWADARKVEISEDMVERAARAINLEGWTFMGVHEPGEYCGDCREVCLPLARAALVAALGGEQ